VNPHVSGNTSALITERGAERKRARNHREKKNRVIKLEIRGTQTRIHSLIWKKRAGEQSSKEKKPILITAQRESICYLQILIQSFNTKEKKKK